MKHEYLSEWQCTAVDALSELKRICDKHGITYYLLAGTTLGAVRHKGMIPWDDDIDTGLLCDDIEKLKAVLADELDPRFEYVSCENEKDFPRLFGKILFGRRSCVDLFVIARWTANGKRGALRWQMNRLAIEGYYQSIGYQKPAPEKTKKKSLKKRAAGACRRLLIRVMHRTPEQWIAMARRNERYYETHGGDCYTNLYSIYGEKKEKLLSRWVEEPSFVEFEGETYRTMGHTDEYLTHLYGDYMQLPPEEDRVPARHFESFPVKEKIG